MRTLVLSLALAAALAAGPALAEPTELTVRAQSRDAKYIGTSMGGMEISLYDQASGKLLAKGLTEGGTGDTASLVEEPRVRQVPVAGEGDAVFKATIDIDKPTLVRLEARGPMGHPDAAITVTSMAWVLPGQAVVGDGWVVEVQGLVVTPSLADGRLTAKVVLMCGCPVTLGGLWDADAYEVTAWIAGAGGEATPVKLNYAGQASTFGIDFSAPSGTEVLVTAVDGRTGNTGVARFKVP